MEDAAVKRRLVYIHSASHSGSTLLALQLARHPEVATVGELSGTAHRARPGYKCSCGAELVHCAFWRDVEAGMRKRGFPYHATTADTDVRNVGNPLLRRLLRPLHHGRALELVRDAGVFMLGKNHIERQRQLKTALIDSVIERTGKPVLVDSSKSGLQLKYHLRNPDLDVKTIFLVRDGRGVALSIKRNQDSTLPQGAYDWRRTNEEARLMARRMERSRWIPLHYEDLCAEPDATLAKLFEFIGVAPAALEEAPDYHVLGHGSRMKGAARIQLNEKWRSDLSPEDYKTFEAIGGRLNRKLGYA
jgi:hypothetical protein